MQSNVLNDLKSSSAIDFSKSTARKHQINQLNASRFESAIKSPSSSSLGQIRFDAQLGRKNLFLKSEMDLSYNLPQTPSSGIVISKT